jgi:hypothetical protein
VNIPRQVSDALDGAGIPDAADVGRSADGFVVEDDGEGGAVVRWASPDLGPHGPQLAECQAILERAGFRVEWAVPDENQADDAYLGVAARE